MTHLTWRIIPLETHNASMNMALDQACMEYAATGDVQPTIRFYQWSPSAVSIGYFQSLEDEIAVERCEEEGIDIVRRQTGGGAVYHDFDGEITYSIIVPEQYVKKGIRESYNEFCSWIIDGLRLVGVESEFKPINDIIAQVPAALSEEEQGAIDQLKKTNLKKISGNAQTRRGGVVLQHGTILYSVDVAKMFSLLKVGQEKIADKLIAAVSERVTSVDRLTDASKEETYQALLKGFTGGKRCEDGMWTQQELDRAHELVAERYTKDTWNRMR